MVIVENLTSLLPFQGIQHFRIIVMIEFMRIFFLVRFLSNGVRHVGIARIPISNTKIIPNAIK